jgi:serine/threonine-protein kinase
VQPDQGSQRTFDDGSSLLGRTIAGKFVLEAVLGVGGSGTVYRARQLELDRTVALKVLRREFAHDEQFIARFKREARAASLLEHPNSVRVLDFGQDEESSLYLAMEHVQGRTLYEILDREWPLEDARIVRLLSQVLAALARAHELGVIHRDLKPENIIVVRTTGDEGEDAEQAKVCDFGLAALGSPLRTKSGPHEPRVTLNGSFAGTPEYMSPEQVRGELGDQRSDIYSLGVVLYHVLAAQVPFQDENPWKIAFRHTTDTPTAPSSLANVHPGLEAVCLKALSKQPADRFASAREMRLALRACLGDQPAPTPPPLVPTQPRGLVLAAPSTVVLPRAPRRRWVMGATAMALALIAGWWILPRPSQESPAAPEAEASPATFAFAAPIPPRLDPILTSPAPPASKDAETRTARNHSRPARHLASVAPSPAPLMPPVPFEPIPTLPTPPPVEAPHPAPVASQPPVPHHRPAPPAPVLAPAPRWDPQRATVSIVSISSTSAIPGGNIRAAMARVPILNCYRTLGRAAAGIATLRLSLDVSGYVTAAILEGAELPAAMRACVESAARAARVKDVDTGEASAAVTLRFTPS